MHISHIALRSACGGPSFLNEPAAEFASSRGALIRPTSYRHNQAAHLVRAEAPIRAPRDSLSEMLL